MNAPPTRTRLGRTRRRGERNVGYTTIDSPLGALLAAATDVGLVRLAYERDHTEKLLGELEGVLGPVRRDRRRLDPVRRQLDSYFDGRMRAFDLPIDWEFAPSGFMRLALEAARRIPFGEVRTYGELAQAAGNPRASRAAGTAMARNPIVIVIPCHRAVRSDGTISNYGWGPGGRDHKEYLLRLEGGWLPAK